MPRAVTYGEELLMGYRYFDAQGIAPAFEFGFGLSYSDFLYAGIVIEGSLTTDPSSVANVSFTVSLAEGSPAGAEVAQLYIQWAPGLGEPPQSLKGFSKVFLTPTAPSVAVTLPLRGADVAVWDEAIDDWVIHPGSYGVVVGGGSRDKRLSAPLPVT
jgi:beta-glucosidase